MVVPVDHHQCSHFMPHFNCFQLPVMSSLSTFPCQIKERQYFLPMKIIICCNQIISQSAFWHEKQHEVVWSYKVIKHFFSVLNHLSASFWTLSSFANHLLKTRESNLSAVQWSWLCRSFVQRENHLHITSFCSHACVSRSHVSPFSHSVALWLRSNLHGGCGWALGSCPWGHHVPGHILLRWNYSACAGPVDRATGITGSGVPFTVIAFHPPHLLQSAVNFGSNGFKFNSRAQWINLPQINHLGSPVEIPLLRSTTGWGWCFALQHVACCSLWTMYCW